MKITFVNEPWRVPQGQYGVGLEYYMRFVRELSRYAGVDIPVVEGFLPDVAPADGFILFHCTGGADETLAELPGDRRSDIASRLVPLDESYAPHLYDRLLESFSIPAAVDSFAFRSFGPLEPRDLPGARGLLGRRDLATSIGASCEPRGSERYCSLYSETHDGIPHLLADYLAAWQRRLDLGER